MIEAETITTVMRALADPTRRAVFERIVNSKEITGGRVDPRQQCHAGRHLPASQVPETGRPRQRAPGGRNVYYRAEPSGLEPLADWMGHYGTFWRERFTDLRKLLKEIDP